MANPKKILGIIKDELKLIKEKYGDERRTKVVKQGAEALSDEDLIQDDETVLVLTTGGYIKRTNPDEYKKQKRGGVGVVDLDTKDEDFVTTFLTATMHSDVLFFTDKGKAYQVKMYELPEGKRATKGKSIMNFLSIGSEEKVTSVLAMPKETKNSSLSLIMVTKNGVAKKSTQRVSTMSEEAALSRLLFRRETSLRRFRLLRREMTRLSRHQRGSQFVSKSPISELWEGWRLECALLGWAKVTALSEPMLLRKTLKIPLFLSSVKMAMARRPNSMNIKLKIEEVPALEQ